jgi:hypothetical protein
MNTPSTHDAPSSLQPGPAIDNGDPGQASAHLRGFSSAEVAFLIGVPLAWAVLLLFHPTGDGEDLYPVVGDEVTAWVTVHIGTLLFVPMIAAAVFLLLRGVEGRAAQVSRIALAPFVLCYVTFEVLVGIGVGLLSDEVNALAEGEQAAGAKVIEEFADSGLIAVFETVGSISLLVVLTAAGIALWRRAGAPLAVPILLVLAAVPMAFHVPPFGQVGLALFIAAVLLVVRARPAPAPSAAAVPHMRVQLGAPEGR